MKRYAECKHCTSSLLNPYCNHHDFAAEAVCTADCDAFVKRPVEAAPGEVDGPYLVLDKAAKVKVPLAKGYTLSGAKGYTHAKSKLDPVWESHMRQVEAVGNLTYVPRHNAWEKHYKVIDGTRVSVIRVALNYELGWALLWAPGQNKFVGDDTCEVINNAAPLSDHGVEVYSTRWQESWMFPYFVLEVR